MSAQDVEAVRRLVTTALERTRLDGLNTALALDGPAFKQLALQEPNWSTLVNNYSTLTRKLGHMPDYAERALQI